MKKYVFELDEDELEYILTALDHFLDIGIHDAHSELIDLITRLENEG